MSKVLRIAIVGAPNSGKTKLINSVRDRLKKDYNILVARNPMSGLVDSGCVPTYNISNIDFYLECLRECANTYCRIDYFLDHYVSENKPTVILYESTPEVEKSFLSIHNHNDLDQWDEFYESRLQTYDLHNPDKVYVLEISKGEYNHKGVVNSFDLQRALVVEERIRNISMDEYQDCEVLLNKYSLEDKIDIILNYIDFAFNPPAADFPGVLNSLLIQQECYYCSWSDFIDINRMYKFCPMCGKSLINPDEPDKDPDPFNSEALRKMFYVDPSKLPTYSKTSMYSV